MSRPPEIIQTSAMDCGPAALAALLGVHGLPAGVDALRGLCATDVDGTSVDDLELVAQRLGLEAEQVVVPLGQVLAAPGLYLPAILVTRTPDGYLHFVVAWRVRRGRVDLVDPAVGRRRVRVADLHAEALRHELTATEGEWAEYALGEDARVALAARLDGAGGRLRDAVSRGALEGVGALLSELEPESARVVEPAGMDEAGEALVRVRGAVLVRAPRRRALEPGEERPAAIGLAPLRSPSRALLGLLAGARVRVGAALGCAALAGLAAVAEVLAARPMLEGGATAARVGTLAAAVAVALAALTASVALALSAGRRLEHRLRERLLARVPRLGDHYVRSRPPGDLAERGHAIALIRQLVELGSLAVQRLLEALAAAVAIAVLVPSAWPAALAVALLAVVVPAWLTRWLAEPDLRARSAQGAVSLQLTDALGAADVLRPLRAAPAFAAMRVPLLALWARAAGAAQARLAVALLVVALVGLVAAGAATALAVAAGEPAADAVAAAVLAFAATVAAQDVAFVARRVVPLRNAMARVLEPLDVALADPAPAERDTAAPAAAVALEDVTVRLGTSCVLDGVTFALEPGEHIAVVGVSGAGKSTLVAVLAGWLAPSAGRVLVDGRELAGEALAELRRATAWSESATRVLDGSLRENVEYGSAAGAPGAAGRLRAVGLGAYAPEAPAGALSRAERQRLLLARALGRPRARLVLLDEAAGELVEHERRALLAQARATWQRSTLIHVTHDVAGALEFPRVLVVEHGRIIQDGPPAALAADPAGRLRALLDAQQRLAERLHARAGGPRARGTGAPAAPWAPDASWADGSAAPADAPWAAGTPHAPHPAPAADPSMGDSPAPVGAGWRALAREHAIVRPVALALAASLLATVTLVLAGERLDSGARNGNADQPGWIATTLALLALTALLLSAGSLALGRAAVALGLGLRRRALAGATSVRLAAESVGRRVGIALDLELLEATALGAGATLAFAGTEAIVALALLALAGQPATAAALLAALACTAALTPALFGRGSTAAAVRAAATEHLVDRLLALRTVTIQEDPASERAERERLLDDLERAHASVDRLRVALAAVLPRAAVLAMLTPLALDPPIQPTAAAGTLGAILLAYGALERLGAALADLTPSVASARAASELLAAPPPPDAGGRPRTQHIPVARPAHILHQTLAVNALLARPEWPPSEPTLDALVRRLAAVDLAPLVERMPMGLGQPLGQTGWRLSQGERARLMLIRALMADPERIVAEDPLGALDPSTAERVLDALDAEPVEILIR